MSGHLRAQGEIRIKRAKVPNRGEKSHFREETIRSALGLTGAEFVNFQQGVDGQSGVADRRTFRRGSMLGDYLEIATGTFNSIGVAVAALAFHRKFIRRSKFIQGKAFAVQSDGLPFRLGNLHKVATHAGEANRLCRSRAGIRGGHLLEIKIIDTEKKCRGNENDGQGSHCFSVPRCCTPGKRFVGKGYQ